MDGLLFILYPILSAFITRENGEFRGWIDRLEGRESKAQNFLARLWGNSLILKNRRT
jgi:hypothetical protein